MGDGRAVQKSQDICMHKADSLSCIAETNVTHVKQLWFNSKSIEAGFVDAMISEKEMKRAVDVRSDSKD